MPATEFLTRRLPQVHTSSIVHIDPEVLIRYILESGESPRLKRRVKKTETGGFILSWLSRKVDKKYAFDIQADVVHETTGENGERCERQRATI